MFGQHTGFLFHQVKHHDKTCNHKHYDDKRGKQRTNKHIKNENRRLVTGRVTFKTEKM